MSAMIFAAPTHPVHSGGAKKHTSRGTQLGEFRSIDSAPSVRRRRAALRLDTPASLRRPVVPARRAAGGAYLRAAVLAAVTLALSVAGGALGLAVSPGTYSGPTAVHAVTSGESVWSIAQSIATDRSVEDVVTDIEALNNIDGALMVGELIDVPTY